jgi:hypothetical protein
MNLGGTDTEAELLELARRRTEATEDIRGAVLFLLALAIVSTLVGLGYLLYG